MVTILFIALLFEIKENFHEYINMPFGHFSRKIRLQIVFKTTKAIGMFQNIIFKYIHGISSYLIIWIIRICLSPLINRTGL